MAFFCSTFRAQDFCLVLAFTALVFSFYSTYVYQVSVLRLHIACFFQCSYQQSPSFSNELFQAGLAELLFRKFRIPLIVLTVYFLLCVSHHVWILLDQPNTVQSIGWPAPLTTLFIIQRMCKQKFVSTIFCILPLQNNANTFVYCSFTRLLLSL